MKRPDFIILVFFVLLNFSAIAQNQDSYFKMVGQEPKFIVIDENYSDTTEIYPFEKNINKVYGLAITSSIVPKDENFRVEFVLTDDDANEYLIYEANSYLQNGDTIQLEEVCEETSLLNGVKVASVIIRIQSAKVKLQKLHYTSRAELSGNINAMRKELKKQQDADKINRINSGIKSKGQHWIAGPTSISEMSYSERKQLFGQSSFPAGFEFYAGGVISAGKESGTIKSATTSSFIDEWDWRNRHGKNWITPVVNQGACGSCWAFASTGAVEALVNVFYNQLLNLDLSEQDVLSCSGAGTCSGGYPSKALDYITANGIVDEVAFPYSQSDLLCEEKNANPSQLIKIGGRIDFGSTQYPKTEDDLKRMLIETGPVSGGLFDWSHAMVLAGYKIVQAGDYFPYRDLDLRMSWKTVEVGDPLIGKIVWIFKNSWGETWGEQGYIYVETPITNFGWTHALQAPVTSIVNTYDVVCTDADGDGYYWWGIGPKPATCPPCPDLADGDDSDPTLGPLDQYGFCLPISPLAQPIADFSTSSSVIYTGEDISFTDLSENTPTGWYWEFEGGTPAISTDKNPVVTYQSAGTFQVKLTVYNSVGSDLKILLNYIQVSETPLVELKPEADFSADQTLVSEGESVIFSDQSVNNPLAWNWEFEGGTPASSNERNPKVTYNSANSYKVTLTVTNSAGNDSKTIENYIKVEKVEEAYCIPVADANAAWISNVLLAGSSNTSAAEGYVDFTDIKTFELEAGSSNSIQLEPSFSGRSSFQYWVVWIDYNSDMIFSDDEIVFSPSKSKSVVSGTIEIPSETELTTRMRVAMSSSAPDACGTSLSGEIEDYTLIISPPAPKPPIADFAANVYTIQPGENIQFADLSENDPTFWEWSFPGSVELSSVDQNPLITYSEPGTYDVSLTVGKPGFEASTVLKHAIISVKNPDEISYCEPTGINCSVNYISGIMIGDVLNSQTGGDEFTLSTNAIDMLPGSDYTVELSPSESSSRNFWRIWIDLNNDGIFNDIDELFLSVNNTKGTVVSSISIPATASGTARMRISMKTGKAQAACDENFDGEVEDYIITFSAENFGSQMASTIATVFEREESTEICVFPNPTTDFLQIKLSEMADNEFYTIFNSAGNKIMEEKITENFSQIDLSYHAPGMYILVIRSPRGFYTEKIIKK